MQNDKMEEDIPPVTLGQPLSDFLLQLEDFTPTVSNIFHICLLCLIHSHSK